MTRAAAAIGVVLLLSACGSSDGDDPQGSGSNDTTTTGEVAVTDAVDETPRTNADPVVVESDDGRATLHIEPGSVDADESVTVAALPVEMSPDDNAVVLSYQLQPSGLEFATPAELVIELSPEEDDIVGEDPYVVGVLLSDDGSAAFVDSSVDGSSLRMQIPHFSEFVMMVDGGRLLPEEQVAVVDVPFSVTLDSPIADLPGVTSVYVRNSLHNRDVIPIEATFDDDDQRSAQLVCSDTGSGFVTIEHVAPREFDRLESSYDLNFFEKFAAHLVGPDDIADKIYAVKTAEMEGFVTCVEPDGGSDGQDGDSDDEDGGSDGQEPCEQPYDTFSPKDPGGIKLGAALTELGFQVTPDTGDDLYEALGTVYPPLEGPLCWEHLKAVVDNNEISPEVAAALTEILGL